MLPFAHSGSNTTIRDCEGNSMLYCYGLYVTCGVQTVCIRNNTAVQNQSTKSFATVFNGTGIAPWSWSARTCTCTCLQLQWHTVHYANVCNGRCTLPASHPDSGTTRTANTLKQELEQAHAVHSRSVLAPVCPVLDLDGPVLHARPLARIALAARRRRQQRHAKTASGPFASCTWECRFPALTPLSCMAAQYRDCMGFDATKAQGAAAATLRCREAPRAATLPSISC